MKKTDEVLKEFEEYCIRNNVAAEGDDYKIMEINTADIFAIQDNFDYPDILNDPKSERLIQSIELNGWKNNLNNLIDFNLIKLPDGRLLCKGNGNHRAAVVNYLELEGVMANVSVVKYCSPDKYQDY